MDRVIVRSAAVRLFFVAVFVLVALAASAHAHAAPPMQGAQLAPLVPPEAHVAGGLFTPTRTEGGISWRAHWVLTPDSAADLESGPALVRFATPLGPDETVEAGFGVTPLVEGGAVTGVVVDRTAVEGRTVRGVVLQRLAGDGRKVARLGAPVAAGSSLQIVDTDLGAGVRFEVETANVLERHVGFVAPPGIGHAAREEARRLTGYEARVNGAALYVRGDDVRGAKGPSGANGANGLRASVVTPAARAHGGTIAIAVAFVAMVAALLAAVRKLRHAASVERADALLAAEVDALEGGSR